MTRSLALLGVTCFTIGTLALLNYQQTARADDMDAMGEDHPTTRNVDFPEGIIKKELKAQDDIHGFLCTLLNAAVKQNDFAGLIGRFVQEDRDRLGELSEERFADLDTALDALHKMWKDKYNHDIADVKSTDAFCAKWATITQGEVTDPAMLSNWPLPPNEGCSCEPEKPQKIDKGDDVALVVVPEEHKLPEVIASLRGGWYLDIPNNIDGKTLKDGLLTQITEFNNQAKNWPDDENLAFRLLTHRVLMACEGVSSGEQK